MSRSGETYLLTKQALGLSLLNIAGGVGSLPALGAAADGFATGAKGQERRGKTHAAVGGAFFGLPTALALAALPTKKRLGAKDWAQLAAIPTVTGALGAGLGYGSNWVGHRLGRLFNKDKE